MKVLLVNPGWGKMVSRVGRRFNRAWPPLGLMIGAALLEKTGADVRIIDGRVACNWRKRLRREAKESDWIGLTSSPLDRWQCPNLEIAHFVDIARELPSDRLLIMGAHGTLFPQAMLKATGAKGVIIGEPEEKLAALCTTEDWTSIPGIVFRRGAEIARTGESSPLDLSRLPMPAFHLIKPQKYSYELLGRPFALFETSRGCPYDCSFCFKAMYGRGVRYKPIKQLMAEIECAVREHGFRYGYFMDLEFTANRNHAAAVCDELIGRKYSLRWCCQTRADAVDAALLDLMRQAGCRLIHFGVESGSPRILNEINKRINLESIERGIRLTKEAGIECACFFMLGFPGETESEMEQTIKLARKLNPSYASFHAVTPYPGTSLAKSLHPSVSTEVSEMHFPVHCAGHNPAFLDNMVRRAYLSYYLRLPYLLERLRDGNPRSWLCQLQLFLGFAR
ncbi:MAG: hypothetical protein DRH43_06440 [Deltaproteobacteria bacterium]|nr:MAG: hypothetical protein DRH43_06440 [Deltaproteobacteria bacterium]